MSSGWDLPDERVEETVLAYAPVPGQVLVRPSTRPAVTPPALVPLRPLGIGELLDGAFRIVRRHPRQALGLAAAISAVVTVVNVVVVLLVRTSPTVDERGLPDVSAQISNSFLTSAPGYLISFLGGLVLTGALVAIVGKVVLGQPVEADELWVIVRSRLPALLGAALLTGVVGLGPFAVGLVVFLLLASAGTGAGALGFVLVLLPAVAASAWLYTRFALSPAVLVLERTTVVASLRRSTALVRGSWWRTFFVLLLTVVIGVVLGTILGLPLQLIAQLFADPESKGVRIAQEVLTGVGAVVVSPFTASVRALLYVDRRMRAEGLDIAVAASAAGVP